MILDVDFKPGEEAYQKGILKYKAGEKSEALDLFHTAYSSGHQKATFNYAVMRYTGDGVDVKKEFALNAFKEIKKELPGAYYYLADAETDQEEKIDLLRAGYQNPNCKMALARIRLKKEEFGICRSSLEQIIDESRDGPHKKLIVEAIYMSAVINIWKNNRCLLSDLVADLEWSGDNGFPKSWWLLGEYYEWIGRKASAKEVFEKGASLGDEFCKIRNGELTALVYDNCFYEMPVKNDKFFDLSKAGLIMEGSGDVDSLLMACDIFKEYKQIEKSKRTLKKAEEYMASVEEAEKVTEWSRVNGISNLTIKDVNAFFRQCLREFKGSQQAKDEFKIALGKIFFSIEEDKVAAEWLLEISKEPQSQKLLGMIYAKKLEDEKVD
jgi:TPR repeat protein